MAVIQQAESAVSAPERRLRKAPYMLAVIVALMWIVASAEAQTILPLLQTLEKQYHLSAAEGAWAISVIGIVQAATTATLARSADIWGVRKLLLFSLATIIVGNLVCAIAPGAPLFILGRAVAGFTAATPLVMAVFRLRSESEARLDRSMGILTAGQGIGLVLSFLLGGLIISAGGSARTAIWVIVLLGVVTAAVVYLFVPESPVRTRVRLDTGGSVLLGAGLVLVVLALGNANTWGWTSATTLGLFVAGVALLVLWGVWENRVAQPMVDLKVVGKRSVWPAFVASSLIAMLGTCNTLAISQYVETPGAAGYGFGYSVLLAGAVLLPVGFLIVGGGPCMAPIIRTFGQRNSAIAGGVIAALNFLWFAQAHTQIWEFLVELAIFGAAFALTSTASNSAYMRGARPGEHGMVAGSANVMQIAWQALGPTLTITLLTAHVLPGPIPIPAPGNYKTAWLVFAAFGLVAAAFAALLKDSRLDQSLAPHAEVTAEL